MIEKDLFDEYEKSCSEMNAWAEEDKEYSQQYKQSRMSAESAYAKLKNLGVPPIKHRDIREKEYRYVCLKKHYPNCRAHDGGFESRDLTFFSSFENVLEIILSNKNEYEYGDIYSIETGERYAQINYEVSGHSVSGISIDTIDGCKKNRTIDDGHGNLIWEKGLV